MMDTEHIPPSSAVIQPCTCLLTRASQIISAAMGQSPIVGGGVVFLEKKVKKKEVRKVCSESDYNPKGQSH